MIHNIFILIALIILLTSNSWAGEVSSVITETNQLKIQFTEKPDFKVIPQDDPFKLKIEVSNSKPGVLSKKMLFHEGLISEVSAQPSSKGLILDILFSEPIKAEISSQGKSIFISYAGGQKEISEKSKIVDITFEKNEEGFEIYLKGDNTLPEPEVTKDGNLLNLTFSEISLATEIPKNLPMKVSKKDDEITISLFLSKDSEAEVFYLGDEVLIDVKGNIKKEEQKISTKDVALTQNSPKSPPKAEKMEISSQKPVDGQKPISLDLQDTDIVGALRFLADTGGYNLVIHPTIRGKINLKLSNITVKQAIDTICRTFNLVDLEDGNIIRILPIDSYLIELILEKRVTKVYKLKYVRPSDLIHRTREIRTILAESRIFQFVDIESVKLQEGADKLEIFFPYKVSELRRQAPERDITLSYDTAYKGLEEARTVSTITKEGTSEAKEGSLTFKNKSVATKREEQYTKIAGIAVDERTGSLIINAPNSIHKAIEDVISKLDVPQKQVLFETRIVELNSSFSKSLGFEWGISWILPNTTTTIVGSQSGTITGGSSPIAVNLPAQTSYAGLPTSAISIGYLNRSGTLALDVRISALQQSGKGKVIANPRILGIDNQVASITQGQAIPYPIVTIEQGVPQVTAAFKDIGIKLALTPRIIDDENLNIYIAFEKEEFIDFLPLSRDTRAPITAKFSESTEVKVKNGETIVLGGIYRKTENVINSKVPGLGDIPLVGELFTSRGRDEQISEVLIFITPRIMQ